MICITCKNDYPLEYFYPRKSRSKYGKSGGFVKTSCKFCSALYIRIRRMEALGKSQDEINEFILDYQFGKENPLLRKCRHCKLWKNEREFSQINPRGSSRKTTNTCDICQTKRKKNWVLDNPEKHKLITSIWKKNNPEKVAIYNHNRRLSKGVGGITSNQIKTLRDFYCGDGRCMSCGKVEKLTLDHVTPLKMGGDNLVTNIQFLCQSCNSKKHKKTVDYRFDMGQFGINLLNGI